MSRVKAVIVLLLILLVSLASPISSQSIPDLVDRVKPSVAFVLSVSDQGRSSGSAFVVQSEGLLVTALHVVEDAREVTVLLFGGQSFSADVVGAIPDNDLAVLRIPRTGLPPLTLADASRIRQAEEVLVVGYPLARLLGSYDVTVTRGVVSALRTQLGLIQVDAAMNPGVSGGPVVNMRGEVIGIAVSGLRTGQQVNFAAPSWALKPLLDSFVGRSVAELPKVRLPLTGSREVESRSRKAVSANSTGTETGVSCLTPPPAARAITGVRGNLRIPGNLMAIAWLSLQSGVPRDDRAAFGHLFADQRRNYDFSDKRYSVSIKDLDLQPEPVCVSYTYKSPLLCANCEFEAVYWIQYKVREISIP